MTKPTAHFSPHGGQPGAVTCTEAIVELIRNAERSISGISYSFTSEVIADALIAAHTLGVKVDWIVDARMCNERGGQAHRMKAAGLNVLADASHPICHDKYCIVDDLYVKNGSFNDSKNAENNAENMVIWPDRALALAFSADWDRHRAHAIALPPPRVGAELPWVEVAGNLLDGWRVHINGVAVGPTATDHRDLEPVVRWLRAALGDLAAALGAGDAEGGE